MKVKLIVLICIGFAILAPLLLLLLKGFLHSLQYPAPAVSVGPPPSGFAEVVIPWKPGESATGWFYSGAGKGPVILYFHGNGENLETLKTGGLLDMLMGFGLSVLAVDYPGYGRTSGEASEANLLQLADASVRWIHNRNSSPGWISAGWSLGAAVAIRAAARNPDHLKGLIVLSGWSSLQDTGAAHFPEWLVKWLVTESYDSVSAAGAIRCPALVIHGENDSIIPLPLAKKVADALPHSRWVVLPGTGHNDLLSNERVRQEIAAFLKN